MASEIRIDPIPIISDDGFSVSTNFTNTGNADFNGCIILKLYKTGGQLMTKVSFDPTETLMPNKSFSANQIISSGGISLATGDYYVELWYEASCGSSEQEINSTSTYSNKKEVKGLKIIPMLEVKPLDFSFEKEGGANTIKITSNTVWNVNNNPSWLKFPTNRSVGNMDLTFNCDSNITFFPRAVNFSISATGTKTFDLSVKQNAIPLSECTAPTGLRITGKDYTWAKFAWNPVRGTNFYQLRYKNLKDSVWTTVDSIQGTSYDISNLHPCSTFSVQISAICANIKSPLSMEINFKTEGCDDPYCFSYGAGKSDWIESITISDKSFTSGQNLGYANKMDVIGNVEEGRIHSFRFASKHNSLSKTDLYRWQLFIDFNGDKDFNDTLEQVYNAVIPKFTSVTGVFKNITIPEDMPIGLTRLRIMLTTNKSDNNACEISPEVLEVEDYGINVKKNRDSIFLTPDTAFLKNTYTTLRANVRASTGWDVTKRPSWVSTTYPSWAATPNGLNDQIQVTIETGKPGILVGELGSGLENVLSNLKKILPTNRQVTIKVFEVEKVDLDAKLLADLVAEQLEKRIAFRRAIREALQRAQKQNVNGIKIQVSGRLNGAEIARSEWIREGRVPLQTLRADIDYATSEANTIYGVLGIKVWLFRNEILSK